MLMWRGLSLLWLLMGFGGSVVNWIDKHESTARHVEATLYFVGGVLLLLILDVLEELRDARNAD